MAAELVYHRGLTLDQIADLTDWQIRDLYYAPRDEDGNLLRETSDPDNPREPFLPPDEAGVPQEAIDLAAQIRPAMDGGFVTMWWSVWRNRGWSDAAIMERWRKYLPSGD